MIVPNLESTEAVVYPVKLMSRSQRLEAESPDIENLRRRFREADAEFRRATLIASPSTIESADLRRRQATAELERYLQTVPSPRASLDEEELEGGEDHDDDDDDENSSWIFRRSLDFSTTEIGPTSKEQRRRSRGFSLLSEDNSEFIETDSDDLEIFVGFQSFDDSVFNSTDF